MEWLAFILHQFTPAFIIIIIIIIFIIIIIIIIITSFRKVRRDIWNLPNPLNA